jgi:hypothetical protein
MENNKTLKFRILGINLPITMDLSYYGKEFYSQNIEGGAEKIIWLRKKNTNNIYKISQSGLTNKVNLIQTNNGSDNILISFTDTRNEGDPLNTFTRSVSLPHNLTYNFVDGIKNES